MPGKAITALAPAVYLLIAKITDLKQQVFLLKHCPAL